MQLQMAQTASKSAGECSESCKLVTFGPERAMGDDGDSYVELVKASGKCIVEFYQVSIGGERLPFVNP